MAMEKDILSKLKDSLPDIKSGALKVFGNVVLSLILYGFEELMEKEIQCPCALKSNGKYISFTFIIPAILLFLISLLALKDSQIWCKLCQCYKQEDKYKRLLLCLFILMTMVKASTPAMIWVVLLFLDGDYYACSNLMGKNETASVEACVSTCNKNFSEIPVTLQKLCFTSQMMCQAARIWRDHRPLPFTEAVRLQHLPPRCSPHPKTRDPSCTRSPPRPPPLPDHLFLPLPSSPPTARKNRRETREKGPSFCPLTWRSRKRLTSASCHVSQVSAESRRRAPISWAFQWTPQTQAQPSAEAMARREARGLNPAAASNHLRMHHGSLYSTRWCSYQAPAWR
uniref:uncharacterized protein isoform X1 n=1 Tax=Pristiophorus japonicus TaxID=55135 RepID=UPI00398E32D2